MGSIGWRYRLQRQMLERAGDVSKGAGSDLGVERGGFQLLVSEQHLDDTNIDALLKQVSRKAVPKGVH